MCLVSGCIVLEILFVSVRMVLLSILVVLIFRLSFVVSGWNWVRLMCWLVFVMLLLVC